MPKKIEFNWSWIYEQAYHSYNVKSEDFEYEQYQKETSNFISKIEESWNPLEQDIIKYLENLTSLKFNEDKIKCYVVKRSRMFPISDPLTIPIELEIEEEAIIKLSQKRYIDMLIHELIPNLMIQNKEKTNRYFIEIFNLYPNEDFETTIHLIIHSLHKKIFERFFSKERLEEEINNSNYYPAYKRSWEIIQKEGSDKIIKEFKNLL